MLVWLDGQSNIKGHPNENWSREVMELFTLGIGNYTEQDVREAARASTGWVIRPDGTVAFNPQRFDAGSKTILGQTGTFDLDDFSRLLANRPQTARFIAHKLFVWFAGDDTDRRRSRADARCMEHDRGRDPLRAARPLPERCLHAGARDDGPYQESRLLDGRYLARAGRGHHRRATGGPDRGTGYGDLPPAECRRLAERHGMDQPVQSGAPLQPRRRARRQGRQPLRQGGCPFPRPRSPTASAASPSRTTCAADCSPSAAARKASAPSHKFSSRGRAIRRADLPKDFPHDRPFRRLQHCRLRPRPTRDADGAHRAGGERVLIEIDAEAGAIRHFRDGHPARSTVPAARDPDRGPSARIRG